MRSCVFNQTKSFEDKTFFPAYYDAKQVRINQEKHLITDFPLSYQLIISDQAALMGRLAGTG